MPAAAVIPEWLALFGMIGRKGYVGWVNKSFTGYREVGKTFVKETLEWTQR